LNPFLHGIWTPFFMIFEHLFRWYLDPFLYMVFEPFFTWYLNPFFHGIWTPF
jgi:hypothetical protein